LLSSYLEGSQYKCTLRFDKISSHTWHTLAVNKFNEAVAGIIQASDSNIPIIILPQLRNKAAFLSRLGTTNKLTQRIEDEVF